MTRLELIDQKIEAWTRCATVTALVTFGAVAEEILNDLREIRKAVEDGSK